MGKSLVKALYLDDGTMVVVDNAKKLVGQHVNLKSSVYYKLHLVESFLRNMSMTIVLILKIILKRGFM